MPKHRSVESAEEQSAHRAGHPQTRDRISPQRRSANMSAIRSTDTSPELMLRRELWRRGLRYRLRRRVVGTRPDIVFSGRRIAVFVDGCFWHGCPVHYRPPVGNASYWSAKIEGNCARDRRNDAALAGDGWRAVHLWECEVRADVSAAAELVIDALRSPGTLPPVRTGEDANASLQRTP